MRTVGDLFCEEPTQWGLRGDQYLWQELSERLAEFGLPVSVIDLHRLLENSFWEATGQCIAFCGEFQVERFSHGGMSSGYIAGDFWRQKGFPLIVNRYLEVKR